MLMGMHLEVVVVGRLGESGLVGCPENRTGAGPCAGSCVGAGVGAGIGQVLRQAAICRGPQGRPIDVERVIAYFTHRAVGLGTSTGPGNSVVPREGRVV